MTIDELFIELGAVGPGLPAWVSDGYSFFSRFRKETEVKIDDVVFQHHFKGGYVDTIVISVEGVHVATFVAAERVTKFVAQSDLLTKYLEGILLIAWNRQVKVQQGLLQDLLPKTAFASRFGLCRNAPVSTDLATPEAITGLDKRIADFRRKWSSTVA